MLPNIQGKGNHYWSCIEYTYLACFGLEWEDEDLSFCAEMVEKLELRGD